MSDDDGRTILGLALLVGACSSSSGIVSGECVTFDGANRQVWHWPDVPSGIEVGDSPVGDRSKMYAIRIDEAVWLTSVPPDGSGGGLTLPVNEAARQYDKKLGTDVDVTKSVWADLAAGAEAASAGC